jgi:ecotin
LGQPDCENVCGTDAAVRVVQQVTQAFSTEKDMKKFCASFGVWFLCSMVFAHATDNMKAFAPPEKVMVRYVLQVQKQEDESAFKVELIVGRTVEVDEGNRFFFGGKIDEETIKGWGFPRYNVSNLGPMAGTMMAVDPNTPKVNRFVTLGGAPYLIRYNSLLPIVVYAPEGVEVRYRIWTTGPEMKVMEEG